MKINNEITIFDYFENNETKCFDDSDCKTLVDCGLDEIMDYYDELNKDLSHRSSTDDICTPMKCVKTMIDYVPDSLWKKKRINVLDPCCGNGNFGAYCMFKTKMDNIWFIDINDKRLANCKKILNPKNISKTDFFKFQTENDEGFDLIMGNPPYSGGGNKNQSLSNDFIERAIDLLNDKGYLCFITPNNWMTYNNNNTTLKKLLNCGSFIVIDNDVKKYFSGVGSSFTIFIWQKNVFDNKTKVINHFLINDIQNDVRIPNDLKFIPLYLSQSIIDIIKKAISPEETGFKYRCDLKKKKKKALLSDIQDDIFKYPTIHTIKKLRYAKIKQDIYDKWVIIIPLSTYFIPVIKTKVNTTQSVGYYEFNTKKEAEEFLKKLTASYVKVIVHLTRYGNFNNIMVLKHIILNKDIKFTAKEKKEIERIVDCIKY